MNLLIVVFDLEVVLVCVRRESSTRQEAASTELHAQFHD